MNIEWVADADGLALAAEAWLIAELAPLRAPTVALPTGATPRGLYERLIRRHRAGDPILADARFFNLDEFIGLSRADPRSYAAFLRRHFLEPLGIPAANTRLLHGETEDPEAECHAFDAAIEAAGGLDLAILGLGSNGHIAFNEPGGDWRLRTHIVSLAESTRRAQHLLFGSQAKVPRQGLTMGIATLQAARAILLLAMGEGKAAAMAALQAGRADPSWPVTSLLDHPRLHVVADGRLRA